MYDPKRLQQDRTPKPPIDAPRDARTRPKTPPLDGEAELTALLARILADGDRRKRKRWAKYHARKAQRKQR